MTVFICNRRPDFVTSQKGLGIWVPVIIVLRVFLHPCLFDFVTFSYFAQTCVLADSHRAAPGSIAMMKIDCEVMNTQLLHIKQVNLNPYSSIDPNVILQFCYENICFIVNKQWNIEYGRDTVPNLRIRPSVWEWNMRENVVRGFQVIMKNLKARSKRSDRNQGLCSIRKVHFLMLAFRPRYKTSFIILFK